MDWHGGRIGEDGRAGVSDLEEGTRDAVGRMGRGVTDDPTAGFHELDPGSASACDGPMDADPRSATRNKWRIGMITRSLLRAALAAALLAALGTGARAEFGDFTYTTTVSPT